MLGMKEPENECVKYNGTMTRKAEGGGFIVLGSDAVLLCAWFPMFLAKHLSSDSTVSHCRRPEYR